MTTTKLAPHTTSRRKWQAFKPGKPRHRASFTPPPDPFWAWFWSVVRAGRTFESVEQAQAEFEALKERN